MLYKNTLCIYFYIVNTMHILIYIFIQYILYVLYILHKYISCTDLVDVCDKTYHGSNG